jgi:mono/diheme cytochrome c family protein
MRRRFRYATLLVLVASVLIGGGLLTGQGISDPQTVTIKNPTKRTRASITAGKKAYDINCASCHGKRAEGAEKAGTLISIIEEQGGRQPPDLTDSKWDHGSTDDSIYTTIKKGVPGTMMASWNGRIRDREIWNIVNYLRSLAPKK